MAENNLNISSGLEHGDNQSTSSSLVVNIESVQDLTGYPDENREVITQTSDYSSVYMSADPTRKLSPTVLNKILDWISTLLWKCTPGCQVLSG